MAKIPRNMGHPRRPALTSCGPAGVRKRYREFLHEEFVKASRLADLADESGFLVPRPVRLDEAESAIDFEYVPNDGSAKDLYLDYGTCRDASEHPMLGVVRAAGQALARIHALDDIAPAARWQPSPSFRRSLERCGFPVEALGASRPVLLHGDYCLQNVSYRFVSGRLMIAVFDASPDYVQTFHPWSYGPACLDLGCFLSGLEGRLALRHYGRMSWSRIPRLKHEFVAAYNELAAEPVDLELATAIGFAVARDYFRTKHRSRLVQRLAMCLLYNRLKGNAVAARCA